MAISSGFFNSIDGDRLYNADDMTTYFEGLVSDGVYENVDDALIVLATGEGLNITVGAGRAIAKMRWLKNSAALPLTLSAADVQYDRIDAIVIKCDLSDSARAVTIEVKQGTPAANPATPDRLDTQTVKELVLAYVRVKKGATALYQSNIIDMRGSAACGWVTGIIKQVDTSRLFLQYETAYSEMLARMEAWEAEQKAAFESWYSTLTSTISVNTKLHKTQYAVTTTIDGQQDFPLIDGYEDGDVLIVHINGVFLNEGTEYFVIAPTDSDAGKLFMRMLITAGNVITQILIKSVIGDIPSGNEPAAAALAVDGTEVAAVGDAEYGTIEEG